VVAVAAAVEDAGLDARPLGALGEQLAARFACSIGASLRRSASVQDDGEGAAGVVVDQLGEDAAVGAVDGQPRALGAAADLRRERGGGGAASSAAW
jgi:hypothetical protein